MMCLLPVPVSWGEAPLYLNLLFRQTAPPYCSFIVVCPIVPCFVLMVAAIEGDMVPPVESQPYVP